MNALDRRWSLVSPSSGITLAGTPTGEASERSNYNIDSLWQVGADV